MTNRICKHAASGCNYPEGECLGVCMGGDRMRHTASDQIEWLEKVSGLHRQIDILYVVDGYEVTVTWDDAPISDSFHGETVADAISKAMDGFNLDACHLNQTRDFYGNDRQMAALTKQRDELLAALKALKDATGQHIDLSEALRITYMQALAVIAKATSQEGGAA